jgi:3-dehydroquinate dehydratase-2
MKIIIINGPNLNLIGKREPQLYGNDSFEIYLEKLRESFNNVEIDYFQSNIEGELIDKLQQTGFTYDGIILNGGGYSHTSVSIADAVRAIKAPVISVHISNVFSREDYRKTDLIAEVSNGMITGFGLNGYKLAMTALTEFV